MPAPVPGPPPPAATSSAPVPTVIFKGITTDRLTPYMAATNGDPAAAFKLYRWNVNMSGALHEALHVVEVVLRNVMDAELCAWNAKQTSVTGRLHSSDWINDPARLLERIVGQDLPDIRTRAEKAVRRSASPGRPITHGDCVAQVNFGTWRFLLPPSNTNHDPGKQRLWDDALQHAFPALSRARQALVSDVDRIHRMRNRVAHLEPFIIPGQAQSHRVAMQRILRDIDPAFERWLAGTQRITTVAQSRP